MNYKVLVSIPVEPLLRQVSMISEDIFERTAEAAELTANLIAQRWREFASGGEMPDGRVAPSSPGLAASIKTQKQSAFHWIVSSDHADAKKYETGSPQIDMKDIGGPWLTGKKTRVSEDGTPYLIIPFRHGVPGAIRNAMPGAVYKAVLSQMREGFLKKSTIAASAEQNKGAKEEPNIHGDMIPRASYNWGGTFITFVNSKAPINLSRYEGMYVFDTSSGKQTRSSYVTFRTLSPKADPDKWIIKAKPGYKMAKAASEDVFPVVKELLEKALKIDLGGEE